MHIHENNYETLSETLNALNKRGYTEDLNLQSDCLECPSQQLKLHPEEFEIDEVYRFEGMTNPADNSVVYAISSEKLGVKGVLVDAYGADATSITPEMAQKLKSDYRSEDH